MEMRKCKECGKMFMPKGREKYCSDVHYRPCPVCGTLVIAKYLSDPPRKCDNCKKHRSTLTPTSSSKQNVHNTDSANKSEPNSKPAVSKPKSLFNFTPKDSSKWVEPKFGATMLPTKSPQSKLHSSSTKAVSFSEVIQAAPEPVSDSDEFCNKVSGTVMLYIGSKQKVGFIPGHEYLIKVIREDYVYEVSTEEDVTAEDSFNYMRQYASQISFYQNFRTVEDSKREELINIQKRLRIVS
jgi:hypothetical protein